MISHPLLFSIGLATLVSASVGWGQVTIDKRITVLPIFVRNTGGSDAGSNPGSIFYEAETDKIFSQAGIDVEFLPVVYFDNSTFLNISPNIGDPNSLFQLAQPAFSAQPWSRFNGTYPSTAVRMFFTPQIGGTASILGFTLQSLLTAALGGAPNPNQQYYSAIANSAFTNNRRDVVAHELGHLLALDHDTYGAGGPLNLMTDGTGRTAPTFLGDIYPDGIGTDQLLGAITAGNPDFLTEQIDAMRSMPIAVNITPYLYTPIPEPHTVISMAGLSALALVVAARRWRKRAV